MQQLIDAGAYITFKEENGLEMVAEFSRECGGETMQRNTIGVKRERFFLQMCMYVGPRHIALESWHVAFNSLN